MVESPNDSTWLHVQVHLYVWWQMMLMIPKEENKWINKINFNYDVEVAYETIIQIIIICEWTTLQINFAHADVQNHMK